MWRSRRGGKRVAEDTLPLLSLLRAEPLQGVTPTCESACVAGGGIDSGGGWSAAVPVAAQTGLGGCAMRCDGGAKNQAFSPLSSASHEKPW